MTLQEALKVNGKAVHPMYDGVYFIDDFGLQYEREGRIYLATISFNAALDENWQPFKQPCKHEPKQYDFKMGFKMGPLGKDNFKVITEPYPVYFMECKHCGAKIKATGWDEMESQVSPEVSALVKARMECSEDMAKFLRGRA